MALLHGCCGYMPSRWLATLQAGMRGPSVGPTVCTLARALGALVVVVAAGVVVVARGADATRCAAKASATSLTTKVCVSSAATAAVCSKSG